jgi:hypothetical protein
VAWLAESWADDLEDLASSLSKLCADKGVLINFFCPSRNMQNMSSDPDRQQSTLQSNILKNVKYAKYAKYANKYAKEYARNNQITH